MRGGKGKAQEGRVATKASTSPWLVLSFNNSLNSTKISSSGHLKGYVKASTLQIRIVPTMETTNDRNIHAADSPPEAQEAEPVIRQPNRSYQPSDQVIDREIVNEDGDILVQTSSQELLVSSKILTLASPVFKTMFNSKFLEGSAIRSVQNPLELPLPDDDPDALAVLFHTLHFSSKRKFLKLGADLQLDVAQLSDKYDCATSIYGESGRWLRSLSESDHSSLILWKSSTIDFLMGHIDEFSNLTAKLVLKVTAAELDHTASNSASSRDLQRYVLSSFHPRAFKWNST